MGVFSLYVLQHIPPLKSLQIQIENHQIRLRIISKMWLIFWCGGGYLLTLLLTSKSFEIDIWNVAPLSVFFSIHASP